MTESSSSSSKADEGKVVDESTLERAVEEGVPNSPDVKELVPLDGKLSQAMENFLLAAPERQILQGGGLESLLAAGDAARAAGKNVQARINYDQAAKFEIYKQDLDGARKALTLAEEVTEKNEKFSEYHLTLLRNLDQALLIAREYYGRRSPAAQPL
jgi:hypothetical protein